jgi:hypothetical protein
MNYVQSAFVSGRYIHFHTISPKERCLCCQLGETTSPWGVFTVSWIGRP